MSRTTDETGDPALAESPSRSTRSHPRKSFDRDLFLEDKVGNKRRRNSPAGTDKRKRVTNDQDKVAKSSTISKPSSVPVEGVQTLGSQRSPPKENPSTSATPCVAKDTRNNDEASDADNTSPGKDADAGNDADDDKNEIERKNESPSESPAPASIGVTGANVKATGAVVALPNEKQEGKTKRGRHLASPKRKYKNTLGPFSTCVAKGTLRALPTIPFWHGRNISPGSLEGCTVPAFRR